MSEIVDSDGKVTIPERLRHLFDLTPGTSIDFELKDGQIVMRRTDGQGSRFARLREHAGLGMTTDELMEMLRGDD